MNPKLWLPIALLIGACFTQRASAQQELTAGPVEVVAQGLQFTEGPVWLPTSELVFSDIPADTIYRADKTVFRKPSGKSNGLTLDPQGRLIACEHWNRRVTRTEKDGSITVLAESYEGKRLNSPNDAIVRSDGTVFFTDPPYGLEGREAELSFNGVFAISPDGKLKLLAADFNRPNGIALSPDQKILYVADVAENHIKAFDLADDGSVSNPRLFCRVPTPDGIRVDAKGYLWSSARDGVRVFNPEGEPVGKIRFPQQPANLTFGGEDSKTLFVTARTAVYKVRLR